MSYPKHAEATYVVRWGDIWKAGVTNQRRWRKFELRGAEVVDVTYYETGVQALRAENLLESWFIHLGHPAFPNKAAAVESGLLGTDGGGWVECYCLCDGDPSHDRSLDRSVMRSDSDSHDATPTKRNGTNETTTTDARSSLRDVPRAKGTTRLDRGAGMTADLTALLDRLEAAAAAATPGPWATDEALPGSAVLNAKGFPIVYAVATLDRAADAALIVAAVNALPVLIAELRRHQAAAQDVRELADECDAVAGPERAVRLMGLPDRLRAAVAALDPKEQTDE